MGEDPALLEQRADECANAGDYAAALAFRESAFAAWRVNGDVRRAAYLAAYQIAFDYLALYGNQAVAQGWLERATSLIAETGECAEAGWVALSRALHVTDPAVRASLIFEATRLAERYNDIDLKFDALAYAGLAAVEDGNVSDGMRRLDEAAAAARGGEVSSSVVAGEIYCKLLVACESTLDVRRAEEWLSVAAPLGDQRELAWASAICRMHYGGILVIAGRWEEAQHELTEAMRLYDASYRSLRSAALVRLAELRVRQGRLSEARELLVGQALDGYAVRPWARMEWLSATDATVRASVTARLERILGKHGCQLLDVPVLALLTDMHVACANHEAATRTVRSISELTTAGSIDSLMGYARQSNACVAAVSGNESGLKAAANDLETALAAFTAARLPLEAAGARLRLAELMRVLDPALARAEAQTAAEEFARLGASLELDRATALLRTLGGPARTGSRRVGSLTDRETEVLGLIAQGLGNRRSPNASTSAARPSHTT